MKSAVFIKNSIITALTVLLLGFFVFSFSVKQTAAAYDGNRIIDDLVFLHAQSMNSQEIQNFLVARGGAIANKSFLMDCSTAGAQANNIYISLGAPCGQTVLASSIIYYTAQVYGVNPRVILATMQKEQSLITATNPTNRQYVQAMGYGCPTTGSCDDSSNFFWQVDNGTWVLRFHYERARGNMSWWYTSTTWTCGTEKNFYKPNLYPNQHVNFYDEDNVMYRTHFINNAATSAFYCYTPHAYNNPQGLYGRAPFGTVGRYYSGSYNFVYFYETWFGSTYANDTFKPHPNGTLIALNGKVYLIESGKLRHITHPDILTSYRYNWSDVRKPTTGDKTLPVGTAMNRLSPGTVFRTNRSPVYVVEYENGTLTKQHISYNSFVSLGYSWDKVLLTTPDITPSVTHSKILTKNAHPSGALVVDNQAGKVYLIDEGEKRHILNPVAFDSHGYQWGNVRPITALDKSLPTGKPLEIQAGTFLLSGGIYVVDEDINGSFKRPLGPWECYAERLQYNKRNWISVANNQLPTRTGAIYTC